MPFQTSQARLSLLGSLVLAFLVGVACEPIPVPAGMAFEKDPARERFAFQMLSFERTVGDCIAGSQGCAYVRFDYPSIAYAPADADRTTAALTSAIRQFLLETTEGDDDVPPRSVEELASRFLSAYEEAAASRPLTPEFKLERKVFVHSASETVVSLGFLERSYTGGAHGEEAIRFLNLNARDGTLVTLDDVLREGARGVILALAEPRFRALHGIEDGDSLLQAGFRFENDSFTLTENYGIGDGSLTFYYNTYDIGPYTLGPTEIVLSSDDLAGLFREDRLRQSGYAR